MLNKLITKDNFVDITKLLYKEMVKIDDAIKKGFICESEIISEMFDIYINHETKRISYPSLRRNDIISYFKDKKFLISNKIDIDGLGDGFDFFKNKVELDIVDLYDLDMYYFNSVKVATIVARTWYLRLYHGLDNDRYTIKKYNFDELLAKVHSKIVVDQNENK